MVLARPLARGGGLEMRRGSAQRGRVFPGPLRTPEGDGRAVVHPSNPAGHDFGVHNQVVAVLNPPLHQRPVLE
jgi:hypothetical protein